MKKTISSELLPGSLLEVGTSVGQEVRKSSRRWGAVPRKEGLWTMPTDAKQ